ncbi:MAG: hypothetical protein IPJ23_17615 [Ignavibacteriales bacterium]|nr:hypothetical protein [Ignavibacteriales bacterium]
MDQDKFLKAKQLFEDAINLNSSLRKVFLDEKCGNDLELKKEVYSLLHSLENTVDFLEKPITISQNSNDIFSDPYIGKQIGSYIIDGEAGVGEWELFTRGKEMIKNLNKKLLLKY